MENVDQFWLNKNDNDRDDDNKTDFANGPFKQALPFICSLKSQACFADIPNQNTKGIVEKSDADRTDGRAKRWRLLFQWLG